MDFVKRSEQEAMNQIAQRLPNNTFLREAVSGIQIAMEESLGSHLKECEQRIRKELDGSERGGGGNDTIV